MKDKIQIQSEYMLPILLIAGELVLLILLLNGFLRLWRKKRAFEAKRDGASLYDHLICTGMGEAHVLLDRKQLKPMYITENFEELVGLPAKRIEMDFQMLCTVMDPSVFKQFWKSYEKWDRNGELECEYRENSETERWIRITVISDEAADEDLFVFRDITKDRKIQESLQQELDEAEEESRSKTTFLSRMSHEIRTPMNGIIGMLSLVKKQAGEDPVVTGYLQKAEQLSDHLVALINDILDMSRIEAGKIELEEKTFDIRSFANNLRMMFQESVIAKGVHFEVELLNFDTYYLVGDELRLSQVIVNFLSNAVKFTSEGEIRVTFREMLKEDGIMDLMIRVHDTGIGMDPEFINRIFRPFEQESIEISKKYGGTGLGMAISDQIIRLMGGEIVIDSFPGKGSDFTVYIHLPVAENQSGQQIRQNDRLADYVDDYTFEGKHILMAEDNEINAEIAVEVLAEQGAQVEVAANGKEAVDMFAASTPGYYDFILMDIQMPIMDGREASRQIRKLARPDAKEILIFALSADAFLEDERLSIEAGMNGHFAKPVEFDQVRKQIGQIVHMRKEGNR